jgi:hypothetical protein
MIRHIRLHGANNGEIVGAFGNQWENVTHLDAALTVLLKFEWRWEGGASLALGAKRNRERFPGVALQGRFRIECIHMRSASVQEKMHDTFGPAGEMRSAGRQRV